MLDRYQKTMELVGSTMPGREPDAPLFRLAWHARIFALIVALVQNKHLPWRAFHENLVSILKQHQNVQDQLSHEEIDLQYFDCWLEAVEQTLKDAGFLKTEEIFLQIERIRASVADIRNM